MFPLKLQRNIPELFVNNCVPKATWLVCFHVCFQTEKHLSGLAQAELSEVAQSELMELCEQQFAQLEKVNYHQNPNKPRQQFNEVVQNYDFLHVAAAE